MQQSMAKLVYLKQAQGMCTNLCLIESPIRQNFRIVQVHSRLEISPRIRNPQELGRGIEMKNERK